MTDWQVLAVLATLWASTATAFGVMSHSNYKWWRDHASLWKRLSCEWQAMATREDKERSRCSEPEDGSNQIN